MIPKRITVAGTGWGCVYVVPTAVAIGSSICSSPHKHSFRRLEEDLQIKPDRPLLHVSQIQANHFIKGSSTTSRNLPKTCNAGFNLENATAVPQLVAFEFIWQRGPRTN